MKYLIIYLITFCSTTAFGQTVSPEFAAPFIEVTGTAEKEVVPDEIYIGFRITAKLFSGIEAQATKLKNELIKTGISASDLYLTAATSEIIRSKEQKVGVDQSRDYELKVTNTNQLTAVYDAFNKVGIEEARVIHVNHSMIDSLRKEVRIIAIKAAKDKITYLLAAVGQQPGKPLEIKEEAATPYFFGNSYLSNSSIPSNSSSSENGNSYNKMLIKFSYTVKYAIK